MSKWASVKVEKGLGTKPSLTTKTVWRQWSGTEIYPHPIKLVGRCEDMKGFILNCSGGSNTDKYSTSMKEVSEYIGCKFNYRADIHRSL